MDTPTDTSLNAGQSQFWINKWQEGQTPWHRAEINPYLERHYEELLGGRTSMKIFVPLCGKAVDMKWLVDKGHTVVGLDVAREGLVEFLEENRLDYTEKSLDLVGGSVFQVADGKIRLYCCDLFDMNKDLERDFDAVWDYGGLAALPSTVRRRYSETVMSLMSDTCRYVLCVFDMIQSEWLTKRPSGGPPYMVQQDEIELLYGPECNIAVLGSEEFPEYKAKFNVSSFRVTVLLLTRN